MGNIPKGGYIGLTAITGGSVLADTSPFSWRICHVSGAKGIALRFPRGGGGGARSALKSRGRGKASGPGFLFGGRGRRPPGRQTPPPPRAAASFSIPGDTLPPREDEPPPLDLFPILGREGG